MIDRSKVHEGLENVAVTTTEISFIDGENGRLIYRGHDAQDLAIHHSFEETLYLLWHKELPTENQRSVFRHHFAGNRELPKEVGELLRLLPREFGMMSLLRTAVSALENPNAIWPPNVNDALSITAKVPTIIAARHRLRSGEEPIPPRDDLDHATNYLYMLTGEMPSDAAVRALDAYLTLTSEHGLNASTFAARVTTSTQSDLVSAVTSAIGTMKGPLHGGAPTKVTEMLEAIGKAENAEPYLRRILADGGRLMGFGHRVYKTRDPRAVALSHIASDIGRDDPWLSLATHVEEVATDLLAEYKPGRSLFANVEFYAAAVLRALRLPEELYTPTFTLARAGGWTTHILEQAANNRIIRPRALYEGTVPQPIQ